MADEGDRANDKAQQDLELCISAARMGGASLPETGSCHNCAETISGGKFCDSHCRNDWQKRNPGK